MPSQVLAMIVEEKKLPPPEIACQDCHHSTWIEFKNGVKCYCDVTMAFMFQPGQKKDDIPWNCDKQLEQPEGGQVITPSMPAPAATLPKTGATEAESMPISYGLLDNQPPAGSSPQDGLMPFSPAA